MKRVGGCNASIREILFASVAEYNRMCSSKAWRITETTKRFLYNLLRCGPTFLDILKKATDDVPWNWSGQGTKLFT